MRGQTTTILADVDVNAPDYELLENCFYRKDKQIEMAQAWRVWLKAYANFYQSNPESFQGKVSMNRVNPLYVLRNYLVQEAIELAYMGDAKLIDLLMKVIKDPYNDNPDYKRFSEKRPEWARDKVGCSMLSCSS
jgi:uncharacterized protein YdiU (UPF0061 family)